MSLEPLHNRLYVEVLARTKMSAAGLHLPDTEGTNLPIHGRVLGVGPDVKVVKKGDVILFGAYAGVKVDTDGEDRLLLQEEEALARVRTDLGWKAAILWTDADGAHRVEVDLIDASVVEEDTRRLVSGVVAHAPDAVDLSAMKRAGAVYVEASHSDGRALNLIEVETHSMFTSDGRLVAVDTTVG